MRKHSDAMADAFWNPFTPGMNDGEGFNIDFAGNVHDFTNNHDDSVNMFAASFDLNNNNFFDDVFDPIIDDAQQPDTALLSQTEEPPVLPLQFGSQLSVPNPATSLQSTQATHGPVNPESDMVLGAGRKPRQKAPTVSDWNKQKPKIRELYLEQNLTLEETRNAMKEEHNFEAS